MNWTKENTEQIAGARAYIIGNLRSHPVACEYPEGCSCGVSGHNEFLNRLARQLAAIIATAQAPTEPTAVTCEHGFMIGSTCAECDAESAPSPSFPTTRHKGTIRKSTTEPTAGVEVREAIPGDLILMDDFISNVCHNGGQHSVEMDDWCEANKARWKRLRALLTPHRGAQAVLPEGAG